MVKDIYFQRWINPLRVQGFSIGIIADLDKKPIHSLKNWEHVTAVRICFTFDGNFGLGLFKLGNRRLLKLKGKYIKFSFLDEPLHQHKKIAVSCEDKILIFYAKGFFVDVSQYLN